jgi:hypothetical protein
MIFDRIVFALSFFLALRMVHDHKKNLKNWYTFNQTITHAQHPNRIIVYRNLLLLRSKAKEAYRPAGIIQGGKEARPLQK